MRSYYTESLSFEFIYAIEEGLDLCIYGWVVSVVLWVVKWAFGIEEISLTQQLPLNQISVLIFNKFASLFKYHLKNLIYIIN